MLLQQRLPFTVLKHVALCCNQSPPLLTVATALTVYGIETTREDLFTYFPTVATALTVYGIETTKKTRDLKGSLAKLQQRLPFTVLKHRPFYLKGRTDYNSCNSAYRLRY